MGPSTWLQKVQNAGTDNPDGKDGINLQTVMQANKQGNQAEVLKVKKINYTWSPGKFEFLKL